MTFISPILLVTYKPASLHLPDYHPALTLASFDFIYFYYKLLDISQVSFLQPLAE